MPPASKAAAKTLIAARRLLITKRRLTAAI
jgi:hypothetical protein